MNFFKYLKSLLQIKHKKKRLSGLTDISATPGPLVDEISENAFCTVETLIFLKSKESTFLMI